MTEEEINNLAAEAGVNLSEDEKTALLAAVNKSIESCSVLDEVAYDI